MKTVRSPVLFRNFLEVGTFGREVLAVSKENCDSERLVFGARNLLLRRREKGDSSLRSE
jgi:hypothetical protein